MISTKTFLDKLKLWIVVDVYVLENMNCIQVVFDGNNPECLFDGFFKHQETEKSSGEKPVLTDDILICMTFNTFEAGK